MLVCRMRFESVFSFTEGNFRREVGTTDIADEYLLDRRNLGCVVVLAAIERLASLRRLQSSDPDLEHVRTRALQQSHERPGFTFRGC